MKHKFYFGLLLVFFSLNANLFAQNFWVPDSNFRTVLKGIYPNCFTAQDSLIINCSDIQNEIDIDVSNLSISSLDGIQYFISLDSLNCSLNQLSNLPALPASLTKLYCFYNQLTSLPSLPAQLTTLYCHGNLLVSLPTLPSSLIALWCHGNQLISIPPLPSSLIGLQCSSNQLTSLPTLPVSLTDLYCSSNQLASLPSLPASLTWLWCSTNQLTILPALPQSLTELFCNNNQLTSLPALPSFLSYLDCQFNQLTNLPTLPSSLTNLYCNNNQLTILPVLPETLLEIYCTDNQLSSLPKIPGNVVRLFCQNNPISCFPDILPRSPNGNGWLYIDISNTLISCIPNSGTFPLSALLGAVSLPVCTPLNSSCNYNYTVGNVFWDVNGNGLKDSIESSLPIPVYYSGNSGILPDSNGVFYASSDTGNITFQVAVPLYYTATTPASQSIYVQNGIVDTLYFGLQAIPNIKDLIVDVTPIGFIRPGFNASYQLHCENVGTDTLFNVQIKFVTPSQLVYVSALPSANAINGDTLIWNYAYMSPLQTTNIAITDSVFASAVLGDTATAAAWIEPILGDTTPVNNVSYRDDIIRGSYDPNDKSVSPAVLVPNSTDDLEYTIRFQNTGTDTAFTVTVMDKLSALLDISSMQMISSSHNYELSIVNGFAKWIFKNILLPDSNTNELASHGFVKFSIKPLPGLMVTDSIPNAANIYFDYNTAITTNTIVVNVLNPLQVKDLQEPEMQIFPNPVQESIRIVNQHAGPLGKIELINASGKVLETKTISSSTYTWNLQHLPAGTYILRGQGWGQKVVKE
ncbi:MAG: leucine-rich repeat domain-containing protein [Bacteroidetes bacterium]|nr:leucine-rich repeat domain-containing protein [Bacteroidota bacterium]